MTVDQDTKEITIRLQFAHRVAKSLHLNLRRSLTIVNDVKYDVNALCQNLVYWLGLSFQHLFAMFGAYGA